MHEEESIKIKDYQIHFPPLGEGAYGRVYRATYRGISDRALKIFRPGAVDLSTMARELEKISQVAEHQGIVTLHDFDLLNDLPYYAMGLHADQNAEGVWKTRTLEKLCGRIDHREAWRLIRETADAIAYLHRHQIIHCDIKPSNILLTDETPHHIKICDFGQSRGLAAEGFEPVGTPLYASPEQLRDPRNSSHGRGFRWDVYSFGVLAYKLMTGELPRLQDFASAETTNFDPDSTLTEATLEATLAETGNAVDGEQLATLSEAVEEITWPSHFDVPSEQRELIEQCLKLDPEERPADMREVWGRMQQLDQQVVVKRARRLNTIFATLLVVAIWASGFAFVQAQKAKRATEKAMVASTESAHNAEALLDLMNLILPELGEGDTRLRELVAEHSNTFLETRFKRQGASTRLLTFAASTASHNGHHEKRQGHIDKALENFTNAYEIRSELADEANAPKDLAYRASGDLMEIGRIHELRNQYEEAEAAYSEALEWRTQASSNDGLFSPRQMRDFGEGYKAVARVQYLSGKTNDALNTLDEILNFISLRVQRSPENEAFLFQLEALRILDEKARLEYATNNLEAAARSFTHAKQIAALLLEAPSRDIKAEARKQLIQATQRLGQIALKQEHYEEALRFFLEEIGLRRKTLDRDPDNLYETIALAEAFSNAASSDDLNADSSSELSLSIIYLEQALYLIENLNQAEQNFPEVIAAKTRYTEKLNSILGEADDDEEEEEE